MKQKLMVLNNAYIFFGTSIYVGVLWALHFFWFPSWRGFKVDNYYDQFIPETTAATSFFTIVVPIMLLCYLIMVWKEWRTSMRWIALGAFACLVATTIVGTLLIIPVNKILAQHITDQAQLTELFQRWMFLNDVRWVLMTLSWVLMMYYFGAKACKLDSQS